ncbi:MAG: hypothetical protein ACJ764_04450 [Solirubrobacteraceae bacterium]
MFGRTWEPATARIVAKTFKEGGERSGVWEYVADITPSSGAPFRTTLHQPHLMNHVVWLQEGEVVRALADVRHQRAKFDRSDPRVTGKDKPSDKEAFETALNEPPGSPPVDTSSSHE